MTITPAELKMMGDGADLLEALLHAARVRLTTAEQAAALAVIDLHLTELRQRWGREFASYVRDHQNATVCAKCAARETGTIHDVPPR